MQKIITKNFGTIVFEKTWIDGNIHIGRTIKGDYRHIGGPMVTRRTDLDVIPFGSDHDAAGKWFADTYEKPKVAPAPPPEPEPVEAPVPPKPIEVKILEDALGAAKKATMPAKGSMTCSVCGKVVASAAALYGHMKTHRSDPKPKFEEMDADIIHPDDPREVEIDD